jgi:TfoX/Sxy family transcriptional regulator of competence genes
MAYDERLAERIREVINARPGVVEKRMFGGLGWMIGGNMAVGVMREEHLVVRVEPDETAELMREEGVSEFGRPGRAPMRGFVVVDPAVLDDDGVLERWVSRGADRAAAMPPKPR